MNTTMFRDALQPVANSTKGTRCKAKDQLKSSLLAPPPPSFIISLEASKFCGGTTTVQL